MMELTFAELYLISNALEAAINSLEAQLRDPAWDDAPVSQAKARQRLYQTEQLHKKVLAEIAKQRTPVRGIWEKEIT